MKIIVNCKLKIENCKFAICNIIILVAGVAQPDAVFAQQVAPPEIVAVRVGLADRYKVGLWTQVEVTLRGGSEALAGEVSLVVPDGDGVPSRMSTPPNQPCRISPGRETTVRLLCRFGRVSGPLTAEFRVGGRVVARRTFDVASQADAEHFLPGLEFQNLIVAVGVSALGIEEAGSSAAPSRNIGPPWHTWRISTACRRTGAAMKASTP